MLQKNILLIVWIASAILLFLYSFTQVDLNLTLSRTSLLKDIQTFLQYIGYFQRPLATYLYVLLLVLMYGLYAVTLYLIKQKKIHRDMIWKIILSVSVVLVFSYNAFSYDLFNYIFDARIFTHYHLNPYEYKPQDFLDDPMISFMRSIHRTYPYGPIWLSITIPFSYLGMEFFLPTFFLFKILAAGGYISSCYFLEKILNFTKSKYSLISLAFFSLNPLILIESLVSGHNDIVMIAFAIASIYFLLQKRFIIAFLMLLLSIGIKFATVFLLPIFIIYFIMYLLKRKLATNIFFYMLFISMILAFIVMSGPTVAKGAEVQPWYFINVLPFATFLLNKRLIMIYSFFLSLGLLVFYVPFFAEGSWPATIVVLKMTYIVYSLIGATVAYLTFRIFRLNLIFKEK